MLICFYNEALKGVFFLGGIFMAKYRIAAIHFLWMLILGFVYYIAEAKIYLFISMLGFVFTGIVGQTIFYRNIEELKREKNKLSHQLAAASGSIKSVSAEIQLTVDESDTYSKDLFQQSTKMTGQMSEVNQIITESSAAIKNLLSLTGTTRDMAHQLDSNSRASEQTISDSKMEIMNIVEVIGKIKYTSSKAANSIETLKETSDQISGMLKEIAVILSKMKLISINASIEAARAGQAGQGFTVVASEFKALSQMTEIFVQDIETQIFAMKNDVSDVYHDIAQNNENVDNGVTFSKIVEQNLQNMSKSFQNVISMVDEINTICDEQSKISDMVGNQIQSMEELVNTTSQNADTVYRSAVCQKDRVENIAQMSRKLGSASEELSKIADGSMELPDIFKSKRFLAALDETAQQYFKFIQEELVSQNAFLTNDVNLHHKMLHTFIQKHKDTVEAVWTNDVNGRFFCSIPSASIANAKIREWFQVSIGGKKYISKIYISGITKNPCVTLAVPYFTIKNEIIGVLGMDINLNGLTTRLGK